MGRPLTRALKPVPPDQQPASPGIGQRVLEDAVDAGTGAIGRKDLRLQRQVDGIERDGGGVIEIGRRIAELAAQHPAPGRVGLGNAQLAGLQQVTGDRPQPDGEPDHVRRRGARCRGRS
jgi:hypothetical protein